MRVAFGLEVFGGSQLAKQGALAQGGAVAVFSWLPGGAIRRLLGGHGFLVGLAYALGQLPGQCALLGGLQLL